MKKLIKASITFCFVAFCFVVFFGCDSNDFCQIRFDTDGGSAISTQVVLSGDTGSRPTIDPEKEGFVFGGYFLGGEPYEFDRQVTKDIEIEIRWIPLYTVTFETDGGTDVPALFVKEGEVVEKPIDPTKEGYLFLGWEHQGSLWNFENEVFGTLNLNAKWGKIFETTGNTICGLSEIGRGLSSIVVPNQIDGVKIEKIGDYAFLDCINLKSVSVLEGITSIGEYAFKGCDHLECLDVPSSIKIFHKSAISSLDRLEFNEVGKIQYLGNSQNRFVVAVNMLSGLISPVVSANCVVLMDELFKDSLITSVSLPKGLVSIGKSVFCGCNKLEKILLPSTVEKIGDYAFKDCSKISTLTLPDSLNEVGYKAFDGCDEQIFNDYDGVRYLKSLTNGCLVATGLMNSFKNATNITLNTMCKIIASGAFENSKLTSFFVPSNIIFVGDRVLCGCNDLVSVSVSPINFNYTSSYNGEEQNYILEKNSGKIVQGTKTSKFNMSVNEIGDYAFCQLNLPSALILNSPLEKIGKFAFFGVGGLESVYITNLTQISDSAFRSLKDLNLVTIFSGLKIVGDSAFRDNVNLSEVNFPDSLVYLGESAFMGDCSLTRFFNKSKLTKVLKNTFYACESLVELELLKTVTAFGDYAFCGTKSLTEVVLNENFCHLGKYCFYNSGLEKIVASENMGEIVLGEGCFEASLLKSFDSLIVSVIPNRCFFGCASLESFVGSAVLKEIMDEAFKDCVNLKTFKLLSKDIEVVSSSAFLGLENLEYNQFGNICYLGTLACPYLVAVKIFDELDGEITLHRQCELVLVENFEGKMLTKIVVEPENRDFCSKIDGVQKNGIFKRYSFEPILLTTN